MATIQPGRYRPELEPDTEPVLFLVGMRINHLLRPWTWVPIVRAMTGMITELMRNRELGLLAAPRTFVSGRVIQVQQYWASFEYLERYARAAEHRHPARRGLLTSGWGSHDDDHAIGRLHPYAAFVANVHFTVEAMVPLPADEAYRRMCDWDDHARWVPFTKVTTHSPDRFTAWTGIGPLQLEDNMTVVERDDDRRYVKVQKTGPRLLGEASFTIVPFGVRKSQVQWVESVEVPRLPRFLAPVARVGGRIGFRTALRRFAR